MCHAPLAAGNTSRRYNCCLQRTYSLVIKHISHKQDVLQNSWQKFQMEALHCQASFFPNFLKLCYWFMIKKQMFVLNALPMGWNEILYLKYLNKPFMCLKVLYCYRSEVIVYKTLPTYCFVILQRSWTVEDAPGEVGSTDVIRTPDSGELEVL